MNSRLSAGIGIAPDSGAATDLNRLHQLKVGKNRDSEANVHKVAQEFESLFLNEMMKAMRSANAVFAEGNFMNSNESKTYQDMHDQQLAITMSKIYGVALADVLVRQLSKTVRGAGGHAALGQTVGDAAGEGLGQGRQRFRRQLFGAEFDQQGLRVHADTAFRFGKPSFSRWA